MDKVEKTARVWINIFAAAALTGFMVVVCAGTARAAELLWVGDFETGDFSQYNNKLSGEGTRSTRRIVTSPVRNGRFATELTILGLGNDSGTERAELTTRLSGGGGMIKFDWDGPEYWIGFSFLFTEWEANAHTFFQIHAPNEKGDQCDFAGNTFSVWGDGESRNNGIADRIGVRVLTDGGISAGEGAASNNSVVHSYPFVFNLWQDYVVNFRLSTKGEGYYHIWKNGELIYSRTGMTNVNYLDSCGQPILSEKTHHNGAHIGIYAPGNAAFRRIYYDEVRVAQGADGYELVAPGGTAEVPTSSSVPLPPSLQ